MSFETLLDFGLSFLNGLSEVGAFLMTEIEVGDLGSITVLQIFGASLVAVFGYKVVRWFI